MSGGGRPRKAWKNKNLQVEWYDGDKRSWINSFEAGIGIKLLHP
jgi:hypothetical protein